MSIIHELSSLVALPELDLFGVPPTQLMIEKDIQTEHRPISTINSNVSPIIFEIHTGIDEYVQFRECELYMCIKINIEKSIFAKDPEVKLEDWNRISPINYMLHSMIKQIEVQIGRTSVSSSSNNYAYTSYLDALINYNKNSK